MMTAEVAKLLAESAEWRLLGLLFEYPSDEWRLQLAALLPDLADESLRNLGSAALERASPGLHHALFGPSGSVPVREVTYQGGVQFGYLMAELAAYYEAFGYQPAIIQEPDDHLAVEAGFAAYLRMKQALALAAGDNEAAAVTGDAAAAFLRDHLAKMAEPVAGALQSIAPDYLVQAGDRLRRRTGPAPWNPFAPGGPLAGGEGADEMTCGSAPRDAGLVRLEP